MFQKEELKKIDGSYFTVLKINAFCVTLQSKNTGHCWHILHLEYPTFKSCDILHTHKIGTAYHAHGHAPTLDDAIAHIMAHDLFQLNGRKKLKNHPPLPHCGQAATGKKQGI